MKESIARKINIALAKKDMKKIQLSHKINIASGNLSTLIGKDDFKISKLEKIVNAIGYDLKITLVDQETGEEI